MAAIEMNPYYGVRSGTRSGTRSRLWGQVPRRWGQVPDLVPDLTPKWSGRKQGGFTLMEVMIVVAIVAILAAIALPAYQDSVTKTWRNKAASCLTEMSQSMERRFSAAMSYAGTAGADPELPPNTCTLDDGMAQRYEFDFQEALSATTFVLEAAPVGTQAARDGRCGTLTINQSGVRTASGSAGAALCW